MIRRIGAHLATFAVAAAVAFAAANKSKDEHKPLEVELWKAKPGEVKRVLYKGGTRQVELIPSLDERGPYVVGSVTKTVEPKVITPPQPPEADGGVKTVVAPEPPPPSEPKQEVERFIGVGEARELVERVASLNAIRSLGVVTTDKLADFELNGEKLAELTVEVGGATHSFQLGGRTPGGGDLYARDSQSGTVYVLSGDIAKDVEMADTRLMERELLTTPDGKEVFKVVLSRADKDRGIVHSTEHPSFWTDESAPQEKNETLSNWMKKFERLRVNSYLEGEQQGVETLVNATFTTQTGESLGRIEFAEQTVPGEENPRYIARSPQSRWWAVVVASTGSELAADLPSIFE